MNRTTVIHLARRAAMTLLATLLLTMTAQTAWAGDYESENRTVTINALTNGSISIVRNDTHETVSSGTQLPAGTSITVTATPVDGYDVQALKRAVSSWTDGIAGVLDPGWSTGGFSPVANPYTLTIEDGKRYSFYAEFAQNVVTYTVTKDITGQGTVDVPTQSVANQRIWVTCTPGDGYQLTSFSVTRDDENSIISSTYSTTSSRYYFDMPAANVTVRAVFTANVYTVHFDANANDATGTMDNQIIRTGTTEALTTNAFIRTGYVFTGWNTASDGSGMAYADGASVTDLASVGETITLYAQWTAPSTLASSSVNMPATGFSSVTIPVGTTSFKVYDNSGSGGSYSTNCDGYLLLIAPAGCTLQLTGTVNKPTSLVDDNSYLTVRDGCSTANTVLLDKFRATTSSTHNDIGIVSSTGTQMLLYFHSGSATGARLDLTVTVVRSAYELELSNTGNNDADITAAASLGGTWSVTLSGRTLYKDGKWNTLCLPFSVTISGSVLDGDNVQAMTLNTTSSNFADGTLTLNFTAATTIPAGTPFIIKWDKPDDYELYDGTNAATCSDLVSPVFKDVTIDAEKHDATVTDVLTFTGTYAPVTIPADGDNTKLYLGAANKLYYPTKTMTIGTHRAYFQLLGDLTAGEPTSPQSSHVRAFNLNFGDDEATGIISVHDSGFMVNGSDAWYTLDGRRLDGQPTAKGLYIHGGKKVAIK